MVRQRQRQKVLEVYVTVKVADANPHVKQVHLIP